jgi:Omp85 superfamily domain
MLGITPSASAQAALLEAAHPVATDTALAPSYRAGALHRLFLGTGYRDLWTNPVRVEVLDLRTYAGGLRPIKRGNLTRSLRFAGADGHEYVLRAADKVAAYAVAPELRGTLVQDLIQDQTSASHPFSAAVADRLEAAVGVPPLHPRLVILPDDPALGEFRQEFAGMIGYIQERPEEGRDRSPGFAGFNRVIGTDALLRRRRERPQERVDVRRFLAARLLDLLVGDWDRHRDQWRWGRVNSDSAWQPIPRDHDWAFGRYEGLALAYLRRGALPHLVRFNTGPYPVPGLTWFGRDLDRELLSGLEWGTWDSVVSEIRSRLTDSVLAAAAAEMPVGVPDDHRSWLAATLRDRREHLPDAARRFYLRLAEETDLHATDASERITIEGAPDGTLRIGISAESAGTRLSRRFLPSETKEVRLYTHRGADTVVTRGSTSRILVRVIGGGGRDTVYRQGGTRLDFHQGGQDWRPLPSEGNEPPARDWGSRTVILPRLSASSEMGLVFGFRMTHTDYGFRRLPFASQSSIQLVYGTGSSRFGLMASSVIQTANPSPVFVVDASAGGIQVLRFYQPGNESVEAGDRQFHEVRNWQATLAPAAVFGLSKKLTFGVGPQLRYVHSDLEPDRLVTTVRPYGSPSFGEVGLRAYLRWDTRDIPVNTRRGSLLELGGDFVPGIWDAEESFSGGHITAATYFTLPGSWSPTLGLRAGGRQLWGRYPYFEAARIGGEGTVRGYSQGRFQGDAAVFGSAELRVPLSRARLLLPGQVGLLGFTDVGRVFLDGESSKDWHESFGGGVWLAVLGPANVVSLTLARSPERSTFSLSGSLAF